MSGAAEGGSAAGAGQGAAAGAIVVVAVVVVVVVVDATPATQHPSPCTPPDSRLRAYAASSAFPSAFEFRAESGHTILFHSGNSAPFALHPTQQLPQGLFCVVSPTYHIRFQS